jgi:hypothetical protein
LLKNRIVRGVVAAGVVTVGVLGMAVPAHAGSTSGTDGSGDTLDPILTQNDATTFRTPAPSADITSWSFSTNPTARTITASITVAGGIPAEGGTDPTAYSGPHATGVSDTGQEYPGFVGGSYLIAYADTRIMNNTYQSTCTNVAGGDNWFLGQHWQDGFRQYLSVDVTFDGAKWNYTPSFGIFDPTPQGGFSFFELGPGEATVTRTANTITVTANSRVHQDDPTCVGGDRWFDFGAAGDTLASITAFTTTDQVVVLPVTVPGGGVVDDISAVGGLVYTEDWAPNSGYSLGTAGAFSFTGPTCPLETVRGQRPPATPLTVSGQPCNIQNPVPGGGAGFRNSGVSIVY